MSGSLEELWITLPIIVIAVLIAVCLALPVLIHRYCRPAHRGDMCYECCVCFDSGATRMHMEAMQQSYDAKSLPRGAHWQQQQQYTAGVAAQTPAQYSYGYDYAYGQQAVGMQQQTTQFCQANAAPVYNQMAPQQQYGYAQQVAAVEHGAVVQSSGQWLPQQQRQQQQQYYYAPTS